MDTPFVKRAYDLGLKVVPNFTALSEEQIIFYENNLDRLQEAITRGFIIPKPPEEIKTIEKFALLVDLGIITVHNDYVHDKWLTTFSKQNRKKFYYYRDNEVADKNFPNPTRILKPGDRLGVRAFKQVAPGTTTSEERMAFLATQHAIHTGAQGAALVFDQKRDQLPKGEFYASFDEKDRLWADARGRHSVPSVICYSDGSFGFGFSNFGDVWSYDDGSAFFCFNVIDNK